MIQFATTMPVRPPESFASISFGEFYGSGLKVVDISVNLYTFIDCNSVIPYLSARETGKRHLIVCPLKRRKSS